MTSTPVKKIKKISILGCGWLGLPLAKALIKENYIVKGSTTHIEKIKDLRQAGLEPFLIHLDPTDHNADFGKFLDTDVLIINIPPGTRRNPPEYHICQIEFLVKKIKEKKLNNVIYVSSTSVYPDLNRDVVEEDVTSSNQANNKALGIAEEMIRFSGHKWLILRMAGLTGYDRLLVKYFAGKKEIPGGNAPVNLIHREDCISLILHFLKKDTGWQETFNCCSLKHPSKMEFYSFLSQKFSLPAPEFLSETADWKKINSDKLLATGYKFIYPDPFEFTYI